MERSLFLKSLNLKNFATFEDQEIIFSENFNAIIGETGSGKSLILDALQLVLGSRSDKKLIRKDCEYSTVEASFHCKDSSIKAFFDEEGYPFDQDEIVIKRIIYKTGKSKSFINFQACSLQILNNFARRFVDLVGQFENQKLLSETYQLVLLDDYADLKQSRELYFEKFEELRSLEKSKDKLLENQNSIAQRVDYLEYQVSELEKLNPSETDEKELQDKKFEIANIEKKQSLVTNLTNLIDGDDGQDGLISYVKKLERLLAMNSSLLKNVETAPISEFQDYLSELSYSLASSDMTMDEEDLDAIMEKLDLYQKLKRKFGVETSELSKLFEEFSQELNQLKNFSINLADITQKINAVKEDCFKLAHKLHEKRSLAANNLSNDLTESIRSLRMKGATIKIKTLEKDELDKNGLTSVNFQAETNPGEGFFKVKDIASGGELSRILLALRQILSSQDSISIFLFDEIDTGVGGETALLIGNSLKNVSNHSQVIAITHLPQIATYADELIKVEKEIMDGPTGKRTYSKIEIITGNKTESEVISMNPLR